MSYISVQKALIYYTFNRFHLNLLFSLAFPHVVNFIYVANFRFLTLILEKHSESTDLHQVTHFHFLIYPGLNHSIQNFASI